MSRCVSECPLSRTECGSDWFCSKYRSECNVDMCDLLKPITDYVLEERVAKNITKRTPLADIRKRMKSLFHLESLRRINIYE